MPIKSYVVALMTRMGIKSSPLIDELVRLMIANFEQDQPEPIHAILYSDSTTGTQAISRFREEELKSNRQALTLSTKKCAHRVSAGRWFATQISIRGTTRQCRGGSVKGPGIWSGRTRKTHFPSRTAFTARHLAYTDSNAMTIQTPYVDYRSFRNLTP